MTPKNERYGVFISYSHRDAEEYGQDVIQSIKDQIEEDLSGITSCRLVFLDSEALKYGNEWHAKIIETLNECRVFICLLSENYFKSSYCTRERLWWEAREIRRGRLRQATLPVYFIRLDNDPYCDERRQVRDLFGFQLEPEPWFCRGREEVEDLLLKERIDNLKNAVRVKVVQEEEAAGFNTVVPGPSPNFVGRIMELKQLHEICVGNQYPVIEGKAGAGKSELATVYSYGYAEEYPRGRFLIHMEGIRSWEGAVLSLVSDPENGKRVRTELGIPEESMPNNNGGSTPEERRDLHRLIIEKLFARAENERLLLVLDNVDDASLFKERELQEFSLKQIIPDNIHMIATTRHELVFPNERHRAKEFPIGDLDDDASFELFCEIGQNRFPFCKKRELDKDDPEYVAAMEIIRRLNGHVWSLEIIAGQIAEQYDDGVTFQSMLASLRECFSIEGDRQSWRSPAENPAELIRHTLNILKNMENGASIVRLSYFAAMLAPDGRKKDVLRACWDRFFADVTFRNKNRDPFLYAYNFLWRYNLLHSKDDDRMHRLTQAGLKQIMKEEERFDDCAGCLADAMIGTSSIRFEIWFETISATPEIAVYLNKKRPEFFSGLLSPNAWVKLLSADPLHPALVELCPWNSLNNGNWVELLKGRPQFADRCPWDTLLSSDWANIVSEQPRFDVRCPWNTLTGRDWANVLSKQPQFSDACPWNTLNSKDWRFLLHEQPQFSDKCDWNELDSFDRFLLLILHPQFADKCDWNNMSGFDMVWILREQPRFADKCDWSKLDGKEWALLLEERPGFADKCDWDKLYGTDWYNLLLVHPQFADKCDWSKLGRLNGKEWSDLLRKHPQFADKCSWSRLNDDNWYKLLQEQPQLADHYEGKGFNGFRWAQILRKQPGFADKCDWDKLNGTDWSDLLQSQPGFADKCDWNKLSGYDWAKLLSEQPMFADKCPWNRLDGKDWAELLIYQPAFAERHDCPWNKMESSRLKWLLIRQPQFIDKCREHLHGGCWSALLQNQPQFGEKCDWDKLNGKDWSDLLMKQPQFAAKCDWDKLNGKDWKWLLLRQPQFAAKCDWDKLDGKVWVLLLEEQPRFAEKCDWNKLDGENWADLLRNQPQFADKCDWDKLNGENWTWLLRDRQQFADKCNWERLNGEDWIWLLKEQPQFLNMIPIRSLGGGELTKVLEEFPLLTDLCPWEELDVEDWIDLLKYYPQFADNCDKWDELNGHDWANLLSSQPQFADKCGKWDELSGEDWENLLKRQPQFAKNKK